MDIIMKISIIWILSENKKDNKKTLGMLKEELGSSAGTHELFVYHPDTVTVPDEVSSLRASVRLLSDESRSTVEIYRDCAGRLDGDYVTMLFGGDSWSKGYLRRIESCTGGQAILMTRKTDRYGKGLPFAHEDDDPVNFFQEFQRKNTARKNLQIDLLKQYDFQPFYLGGTFVRRDLFLADSFHIEYGLEAERYFFLSLMLADPVLYLVGSAVYVCSVGQEGNVSIYPGVYQKEWYFDSLSKFWISLLTRLRESGPVPFFVQANCMFSIMSRMLANRDNQNKHILSDEERDSFFDLLTEVMNLLSDHIIFNSDSLFPLVNTTGFYVLYGILKYGLSFRFTIREKDGGVYLAAGAEDSGLPVIVDHLKIKDLAADIIFMDYRNGELHIDGVIDPAIHYVADELYLYYDGVKYPLNYNGSFALVKLFGKSVFKKYPFSVDLPIGADVRKEQIELKALIAGKEYPVCFIYHSHYSRMSDVCRASHWCFGSRKQYMMTRNADSSCMKIRRTSAVGRFGMETLLLVQMFLHFDKKYWQFIPVRLMFHISRPFLKRKQIWLYFDKIYKGGDSAEYLYRYAVKQNDPGIRHYYLIDKNTPDYKRFVRDGFKPLVRKTILHRLVFMHADMMIISNSTAFPFNNFGIINSSFVRDLIDSHCVCVQHGMSVQKIAKAQRRLKDNTRLYFCASKYEIENLSKPIYGYEGRFRSALQLTGVPRHDGLIDRHKKQIMISPTWRMQASMKIRTSEGEARDYNPLFKETPYFRVYNSLINDPKLLEAARRYGYRIKYVLHPIVSVQAKDFTKNDMVDIVPSIGDMSYEDLFCESALMVTDFSGVQFDFAYMRKPVLYLHSDEIPSHYEEGTFFYDTMAFGEIAHNIRELVDLLIEYMEQDCVMKEEYRRRADDFFAFHDQNNCRRVYDVMLQYAGEYLK